MNALRVLLVEDDDVDTFLFSELAATDRARIDIQRVDRLFDACQLAPETAVDVVLLDLGLPDSVGLETFIRFRAAAPHLPVVVLTDTDDDVVALAALEEGAQDYIVKSELAQLPLGRVLRYAVERFRLQTNLAESQARFRALVEQADDLLSRVRIRPRRQIEYVSPSVETLTGQCAERFYEDPELLCELVHPDDRAAWSDLSRLVVESVDRVTYRLRRPDGSWAWLEDRRTAVREAGELVAVQTITRDVSARERAEEALRRALDQERVASDKLRAADELKTTFLQAVSHELRTPLTVIQGFSHTLQDHEQNLAPERRRMIIDRLVSASGRLERLLTDLLDVDRLSRGVVRVDRRPTDVAALVRSTVAEMDLADHPLKLICQEDLVAPLDAAKVERLVENLVCNAVKHTPPGTRIYVLTEGDDDGVTLTVADEGPGVSSEVAARLFEPFEQGADAARSASPGTGIGLALVARLAELHGGSAHVEETPGGGATFVVRLPATPDAAAHAHGDASPARVGPQSHDAEGIVTDAVRQILHARTVDEISGVLLATVDRLGGRVTLQMDHPDALPLDLSLGVAEPAAALAPPDSPARARLETHLPRLVEDARRAAESCRLIASGQSEVPPGFEDRTVLRSLIERLQPGDALLQVRLVPTNGEADPRGRTMCAAAVVRACSRAMDRAFVLDPLRFLLVLPQADARTTEIVSTRIRAAATQHLHGVELHVQAVAVTGSGVSAYRELQERAFA